MDVEDDEFDVLSENEEDNDDDDDLDGELIVINFVDVIFDVFLFLFLFFLCNFCFVLEILFYFFLSPHWRINLFPIVIILCFVFRLVFFGLWPQ